MTSLPYIPSLGYTLLHIIPVINVIITSMPNSVAVTPRGAPAREKPWVG